jgi:hypothetical protein
VGGAGEGDGEGKGEGTRTAVDCVGWQGPGADRLPILVPSATTPCWKPPGRYLMASSREWLLSGPGWDVGRGGKEKKGHGCVQEGGESCS